MIKDSFIRDKERNGRHKFNCLMLRADSNLKLAVTEKSGVLWVYWGGPGASATRSP